MIRDLSVMSAIDRAAAAKADFGALCMESTFPEMFPAGTYTSRWEGQSEGAKEVCRRNMIVGVFAYLWHRSSQDPALEIERQMLIREIDPRWGDTLAKVLIAPAAEIKNERKLGRAFGAPLSDPRNGLRLLAWDNAASADLLADAYAREEVRRLNEKAHLMKSANFDEAAQAEDRRWATKNAEILAVAKQRSDLVKEAQGSLALLFPSGEASNG